jgi:hypothetical protein
MATTRRGLFAMDQQELMVKLQDFKLACMEKGYTVGDFYYEDAYRGIVPTSFIVKVIAKQEWFDSLKSPGEGLHILLEVLWETTSAKTRESVFTIHLYAENERHLLENPDQRKAA